MEPSSPIGRTQSGLAASFDTPSPRKTEGRADQAVDDEPYINKRKPSSTTAAEGDSNNGPSLNKKDVNGHRVIDDKPFVNKRKPSSMTTVKGYLHNGEHTLIPVTVKMIHSAIRDCETRINLEEPVRVASPTRINLEEPVRVASPTRINVFLCL